MQNEERNERERLAIQGRYNLEMGIQLAREDFEREIEEIGQDDSLPDMPPEKVEQFFEVFHAAQARIRAKKRRKAIQKRLLQFGAVAAAIFVFVPAVAMNVNASRTVISNYVIQNFENHSVIRQDQENNALPPFGWRSEYYPRWLPEGYYVFSVNFLKSNDSIWYMLNKDKQISFSVLYLEYPLVNSEDRKGQEVMINGWPAVLYTSEDMRVATLVLPLSDVVLKIEGNLPVSQIIQIAESIKI